MTKEEHLWEIVQEEAIEIAKVCSKIQRFGLDNTQPASGKTNKQLLIEEINDFYAALEMLIEEEHVLSFSDITPKESLITAKKENVLEHLEISKRAGRLLDEGGDGF
jgi:hypothetical protein